jgi:threonine dehydrogenase-like Zn-dependent dehydrogenase
MHLTVDLKLAVLGDGTLGILTALALSRLIPRLTLIGRHADKLSIAAQQGVSILRPGPGRERSGLVGHSNAFDVVIEATGSPQGLDLALDLIRPQGAVVLKTTTCEPTRLDTSRIAVKEIRVLGSRCGNLDQALLFLRNRWLDLAPLVSGVYPLAELPAALEHARSPGSLKVLLSP